MSSPLPHVAAAPAARIASRTGPEAVSDRTPAGTWIDKTKTKMASASQPQDQMLTLMMHHMETAADLNTPEIKLEDFNFGQSGPERHGDDHGQHANAPDSALDQGHFYEDSAAVSQELPGNSAIVDMGLGGYDLIPSGFEDRIPLAIDGQPCSVTSSTPSHPIAPMLSSNPTHGNSLSAGPCYTTLHNATALPSVNQQQSFSAFQEENLSIPNDVLAMMDDLFGSVKDTQPVNDEDTLLDKIIYSQEEDSPIPQDLISNALQQAQLEDLIVSPSSLVQPDNTQDCHVTFTSNPNSTVDSTCILPDLASDDRWLFPDQAGDDTQIDIDHLDYVLPSPGPMFPTTSTLPTIPVVHNTPTPTPSLPVLATPTKGRAPVKLVLVTPMGGEALQNRPKRISKKPLKFEEMVMDMELDNPVPSTSHTVATRAPSMPMTNMKVEVVAPMGGEAVGDRPRRISKKPLRLEEMVVDMELENPVPSTSHTGTIRAPRVCMSNMTEKEKYHRIRELNNIASRKSRERKKGKVRDLHFEERIEMARNVELKKKLENLEKKRDLMHKLIHKMIERAKK